ncbi:hypothetical protein ABPG77_007892 [Micractinium sp. CCAP 211/92]
MAAQRALAGLVFALLTHAAFAADLLVLTRDWTPTTCSDSTVNCATTYPNTFRVERLALATDASLEPQTGCTGKGGLKSKDLDKSGLSREELGCAWQNATEGLKSLQNSWKVSWGDYGKCTPAQTAVDYLGLGLQLDQSYPLPNDLPASVDYTQLMDALDRAFGAEAYVTCTSSKQLASISLCFNASQDGTGQTLTNCPWSAPEECLGALAVPRNAQGESTCSTYYKTSPVSLGGLVAPPGAAPAQQPAAAPPAITPGSQPGAAPVTAPSGTPVVAPSGALPGATPSPAPPPEGSQSSPAPAPEPAPEPAPGSTAQSAGTTAGSAVPAPSSDSGPSTGVKIGALCGGIAGGVAAGAAVLAGGWYLYQRKRRRGKAVGSSPGSAGPDPEKGVMASSAESLSSWSSSDGPAKRMDSRSSATSGRAAAAAAAAAAAPLGAGSRVFRTSSGSASPSTAGPRRPESVRSVGSRRSEGGSSIRRADGSEAASTHRLDSGSSGSARHQYAFAAGSGSAKFVQPAGPGGLHPGGGSLPASPARSLARSGGSGSGWDAPASPGSSRGLYRSVSDAGAGASGSGSGSLHRGLSGQPRSPGKAGRFVPATPPKATRYVQPAPPPRSPSSKQGNTQLPSVNE